MYALTTRLENYTQEEINHLTPEQLDAFIKLDKLGVPVKIYDQQNPKLEDYRGVFSIDSEEEGCELFVDYFNPAKFMGTDEMNKIIYDAGLYWDWENPGWINVHPES